MIYFQNKGMGVVGGYGNDGDTTSLANFIWDSTRILLNYK